MQILIDGETNRIAGIVILREAEQELAGRNLLEHMVEAADMVGVRVGVDGVVKLRHAELVQRFAHGLPLVAGAVDEHGRFAVANERRVAAVDLREIHLQQFGVRGEGEICFLVLDLVDDDGVLCQRERGQREEQRKEQKDEFFHG